ncbi:MAG: hypothetical protein ACK4GT_15060 [Pararhodobacter sp.]
MPEPAIPDPDTLPGHVEWRLSAPAADTAVLVAALAGGDAAQAMDYSTRDLYLSRIHAAFFGHRIDATRRCNDCGATFDLDFDLRDVKASLAAAPRPACVAEVRADGRVRLESGHLLRAPTPADGAAVAGLPLEAAEAALLDRCIADDDAHRPLDRAAAEAALEWLAPILDLDLDGTCPECGAVERLWFSMEHYLARSLQRERSRMLREVHLLASDYRWSFDDILRLGRRDRRDLAALAELDRSAARNGGMSGLSGGWT